MSTKLEIIKSKAFKVQDTDHTHYTCSYKGRVLGVSSLRFAGEKKDVLTTGTMPNGKPALIVDCDVNIIKALNTDQITGESKVYLDLVPKLDIALSDV